MEAPPKEVIEAANLVEKYFKEKNIENWIIGGCASRSHYVNENVEIDSSSDIFNLHRVTMPIIRLMKQGNLSWFQMEECAWALQEAICQHQSLIDEQNILKNKDAIQDRMAR